MKPAGGADSSVSNDLVEIGSSRGAACGGSFDQLQTGSATVKMQASASPKREL